MNQNGSMQKKKKPLKKNFRGTQLMNKTHKLGTPLYNVILTQVEHGDKHFPK
jgi:hypothetical protein